MIRSFTRKRPYIAIILGTFMNYTLVSAAPQQKTDTTLLHIFKAKNNRAAQKNTLHLVLPPLKPAVISTARVYAARADDKLLNNVQVFPNPVTDYINLKYGLSRSSNVTIKVMDVLGNDIIILFSQRIEPGEKSFSYPLNSKLTRGFYFVRIVAGPESVIKRISVL